MWPFSRKLQTPVYTPEQQLRLDIKSASLPELTPRWWLFARRDYEWNTETAIKEGYNASAIVYAAVEKRAKLLASVPWVAERKNREGEWEPAENSPLQRLLDRPNPEQSMYELVYQFSQSLDLAGNAYLSEVKSGRQPVALWHLPAQYVRLKPGTQQLVDYYEYDEQGTKVRIQPEDMIHLKMPNPNSRWFGMPVLMAAGRATDIDRESGIWQKASLQNRGVLDIHIEVPEGTQPEQIDAMKEKWREKQGGPSNAREPLFTSGKVNQMGQTAVEMDFVQSRKAVWTEIAAVFGVSLATLGFTEDVNLANAESMNKQLWENTIIPQLELLRRQLTHSLAADFGNEWRVNYDTSNVAALQEGLDKKLESAEKLYRMGVPFNQINQHLEMGLDDIEGGDIGYIPSGLIPASFDIPDDEQDPDAAAEEAFGGEDADGE